MQEEVLVCQGIRKRFEKKWVLNDCSFSLKKGSFTVIVGPSGCGKTTLLEIISHLQEADAGMISINGEPHVNCSKEIAIVFQDPALFPHMSVLENILFGAPIDAKGTLEKAKQIAELLNLSGLLAQQSDTLSGGEKQRTAIGRALMKGANLILMDEPFSSLDAPLKLSLGNKLRSLQQQLGLTILYVTHDQQEALRLADHLIVMKDGSIQQQGTPQSIYERPQTTFVARFMNQPAMNLLKVPVKQEALIFGSVVLPLPKNLQSKNYRQLIVGLRPYDIFFGEEGYSAAVCESTMYLGDHMQVKVHWEGYTLQVQCAPRKNMPLTGKLTFALKDCHFFDPSSGQRIPLD